MVSWFFFSPDRVQHARPQVVLGDRDLLFGDVARQADDFHAVEQRRRNGKIVRGADEQGFRQIKAHVEVMIEKIGVLLGIEHFQQRRSRIALETGADLVDFVEHDDRVGRLHFFQGLHELARHRADVGAAVALDFGLVAHAADRKAVELAPERLGNGFADRGLADAGRPDQQQDRTRHFAAHGAHREKFDDAILHVVQAVVVAVENLTRVFEVDLVLRVHAPRQHRQPVQVIARDACIPAIRFPAATACAFPHRCVSLPAQAGPAWRYVR